MTTIHLVEEAAPGVDAVLARHHALMRAQTPAESCHVMTSAELRRAGARVYALADGAKVLGVGALAPFGEAVELKSMHVVEEARGRGLARALLGHLMAEAARSGARAVYLETGSRPAFAAARALYERAGFAYCPPFGHYRDDPESVFMMRALA